MKSRNKLQDIGIMIMFASIFLGYIIPGMWIVMVIGGAIYIFSLFMPRRESDDPEVASAQLKQDLKKAFLFTDVSPVLRIICFILWFSVIAFAVYAYFHPGNMMWFGIYTIIMTILVNVLRRIGRTPEAPPEITQSGDSIES